VPRLQFNIKYRTQFGQQLLVAGSIPALGSLQRESAIEMQFLDAETWQLTVEIPLSAKKTTLQYNYFVRHSDGTLIAEWGDDRTLFLSKEIDYVFYDTWNHAGDYENAFFTAPFQNVLLPKPKRVVRKAAMEEGQLLFRVKAPLCRPTEQVCLIGSSTKLGNWSTHDPLLLTKKGNWWEVQLAAAADGAETIQYKYGIWDTEKKLFVEYEQGENRTLPDWVQQKKAHQIIQDGLLRTSHSQWRGAGVSIPVFSLRTQNSFGIGEFNDIKLLADWAHAAGLKLIQLLPINDTIASQTWLDSYPYAAISAFALHPIYINLAEVAGTKAAKQLRQLRKIQDQLNQRSVVDYEAVIQLKLEVLSVLYKELGTTCFETKEYKKFFQKNQHWLKPYAVFCYYRDQFGTTAFEKWPKGAAFSPEEVASLFKSNATSLFVNFYCFVQFHLHQQLTAAVDYTHKKGLVLKGDIPIGVYRHGVDTWVNPSLYNMEWQAGAPPDDFTAIGQNWGFPTYNWKKMQEDGFAWWKQRFEQMSRYFDTFRIDHILGFFRIWSIPTHAVQGVMGRFVPCLPIRREEFNANEISFDYDRFCKPFITDEIVWELFGEHQFQIKEQFLVKNQKGNWEFLPQFDTQVKIDAYLKEANSMLNTPSIRSGLLELIANVILFEEADSDQQQFHFRISVDKTWSFKQCHPELQEKLMRLYHDYFYQRQDHFWYQEAMQKLPQLKESTNMLICGEDLGMVPHCVPDVMQQTGILSLEIQRMPKDPRTSFFNPAESPYMAVVTPSTHDMSTIRGWWEENKDRTQYFYNHEMHQWGDAPQFCEAWINRSIVQQHLNSPAMWSIFQLQDLLGMSETLRRPLPQEERINDPANPTNYWQYRMHLNVEDLLKETSFTDFIRTTIQEAGRG
jgi:4-alpha-glucanotransferase